MSLILDGTNGSTMATWTLTTRPSTPNTGQIGYNTSYGGLEIYNGTAWSTITGGPSFSYYANSGQTLAATSGAYPIFFQNKIYDTANCFNNSGSTVTLNGLSVPAWCYMPYIPGYYQFNFSVRQNTGSGEIVAFLIKGGSQDIGQGTDPNPAFSSAGSVLTYMNGTTDYASVGVYTALATTVLSRTTIVNSITYGYDTYFQGFLARGV